MVNAVGRELPEKIGSYTVKPFAGIGKAKDDYGPVVSNRRPTLRPAAGTKLLPTLEDAVKACGLRDGMTISFHHCFREGDMVIGQVLTAIRNLGIKQHWCRYHCQRRYSHTLFPRYHHHHGKL